MFRFKNLWTAVAVASSFAAIVSVIPAEAAGQPIQAGGPAGPGRRPPVVVPVVPPVVVPPVVVPVVPPVVVPPVALPGVFASASLRAALVGTAAFPSAGGTVNYLRRFARTAITGSVINTGLPSGTELDIFVDGVKYETNPTFPANFGPYPGGTLIQTEFGLRLAPGLAATLAKLHAGSRIEVRVNSTLPLLGRPLSAAPSSFAGQLIAVGIFG